MHTLVRTVAVGVLMGAAEIVPGVSGGTIAFISGIYVRLVNAVKHYNPMLLVKLKDKGVRQVWQDADATFLLVLFASMGASVLVLARAISYLLHNQPIAVWSFFFGLVLASVWVVGRSTGLRRADTWLLGILGVSLGFFLTHLAPVELTPSPLFLFLGGMVAVCAWILPGISGSFILLILGLYGFVVEAIKSFDLVSVLSLVAGCAIGLVSFAQVLAFLLARFRNETLSVLTGFMLGALGKLWPWKFTVSYQLKPDGSQIPVAEEVLLPQSYLDMTGQDPQLLMAGVCVAGGIVLVFLIDWFALSRDGGSDDRKP